MTNETREAVHGTGCRPGTILAVDDEPANLALIERLLRRGGHQVTATTDPRTATALVADDAPDLTSSICTCRTSTASGSASVSVSSHRPVAAHRSSC